MSAMFERIVCNCTILGSCPLLVTLLCLFKTLVIMCLKCLAAFSEYRSPYSEHCQTWRTCLTQGLAMLGITVITLPSSTSMTPATTWAGARGSCRGTLWTGCSAQSTSSRAQTRLKVTSIINSNMN